MSGVKHKDEVIKVLKQQHNKAMGGIGEGHLLYCPELWHEYQDALKEKRWREFIGVAGVVVVNGGLVSLSIALPLQAQGQEFGVLAMILSTLFFGLIVGLPLAMLNHFLVSQAEKDKYLKRLLQQHNQAINKAIEIVEGS